MLVFKFSSFIVFRITNFHLILLLLLFYTVITRFNAKHQRTSNPPHSFHTICTVLCTLRIICIINAIQIPLTIVAHLWWVSDRTALFEWPRWQRTSKHKARQTIFAQQQQQKHSLSRMHFIEHTCFVHFPLCANMGKHTYPNTRLVVDSLLLCIVYSFLRRGLVRWLCCCANWC